MLKVFINGLKKLFEDSYIDIPEDKLDLVSELTDEVASLKESLTDAIETTIAKSKELDQIKIEKLVMESADGLTDIDSEKFKDLAKELVFEDAESYSEKLKVIRESYFKQDKAIVQSGISTEITDITEELVGKQKSTDARVNAYADALSKIL